MRRWIPVVLWLAGCDRIFTFTEHPPPDAPPDAPQIGRWKAISAGGLHTCAIDADDRLTCWGDNGNGQLGRAPDELAESVMPIPRDGVWQSVSAGVLHTCAIDRDAMLWCWGNNEHHQAASGTVELAAAPALVTTDRWRHVTSGLYMSCALNDAGAAYCWGANGIGNIGDGTTTPAPKPRAVAGARTYTSISVGIQHACAIETGTSALWCWGYNAHGQIGDATAANRTTPVEIEAGTQWLAVDAGDYNTCALRSDGRLRCWGQADSGQIGDGTTSFARYLPQPVGLDDDGWTSIEVGASRACASRTDGTLLCWGRNDQGQLTATRALAIQSAPIEVLPKRDGWKSISLGETHACLIDNYDNAWCGGNASRGQLGNGMPGSRTTPKRVDGEWLAVDTGDDFTCGLTTANQLRCWGANNMGQIGDGTRLPRQAPVRAAVPSPISTFDVGQRHTLARRANEIWGFGYNGFGQLGNVSVVDQNPIMIGTAADAPPPVDGLIASGDHACVIESAGGLVCWGRNDWSQLGRGAPSYTAEPMPLTVAPGTTFRAVASSIFHTCAIATNALFCWGANTSGQLGDGTGTQRNSPALVTSTPPDKLAVGVSHSCAITGQQLACWGGNYHGELGLGPAGSAATPTVVTMPALQWSSLARSLGNSSSCAITSDNRLYCWGRNNRGQLGIGSFADQRIPTRVDDNTWQSVAMGSRHSCGVRTDRSLWCWGDGRFGQIGDSGAWSTELVEVLGP